MNRGRWRAALRAGLVAAVVTGIAACEQLDQPVSPLPIGATLVVDPSIETVFVGDSIGPADTIRLVARARTFSGDTTGPVAVVWRSEDTTIATVDSAGLVTARQPGRVTIVADAGEIARATIVVSYAAQQLSLTLPVDTLVVGDSTVAVAQAADAAGQPVPGIRYVFESSNPVVATVDSTGLVRAVAAGPTRITVTAAGRQAFADLTVVPDTTGIP